MGQYCLYLTIMRIETTMIYSYIIYIVAKPAPDWNGTAVMDGEFKEIKLADFKGGYGTLTP